MFLFLNAQVKISPLLQLCHFHLQGNRWELALMLGLHLQGNLSKYVGTLPRYTALPLLFVHDLEDEDVDDHLDTECWRSSSSYLIEIDTVCECTDLRAYLQLRIDLASKWRRAITVVLAKGSSWRCHCRLNSRWCSVGQEATEPNSRKLERVSSAFPGLDAQQDHPEASSECDSPIRHNSDWQIMYCSLVLPTHEEVLLDLQNVQDAIHICSLSEANAKHCYFFA